MAYLENDFISPKYMTTSFAQLFTYMTMAYLDLDLLRKRLH